MLQYEIWCHATWSTLVQVMAWCLKPPRSLPSTILIYGQSEPLEHISVKCYSKLHNFSSKKMLLKNSSVKCQPFCSGLTVLNTCPSGQGVPQGWGLLSQFSPFRYFPHFPLLSKQTLAIEYRVHIWQVSPQLSCGDTCQIWMWFRESNRYFCKLENFAYGEISERSFSNPHSWTGVSIWSFSMDCLVHLTASAWMLTL